MYNYNPESLKAEEFINHEEIEDTLRYAQENKSNVPLLKEILKSKAEKRTFTVTHQSYLIVMCLKLMRKSMPRRADQERLFMETE